MTRTIRSFWSGIAAGCAFVVVELLGRVVHQVPTMPELIQDRLVLLLPGPAFAFLLDHLLELGKPLLFSTLLLAQVLLCGLAGVLIDRWGRTVVVAAAIWLGTGLLLLPAAQRGVFAGSLAVAIVTLVASAAFTFAFSLVQASGLSLHPGEWLGGRQRLAPPATAPMPEGRLVRRRRLATSLLGIAAVVLTRRAIGRESSRPTEEAAAAVEPDPAVAALGAEAVRAAATVPGLPPAVTPAADFYVVSKNLFDPEPDARNWQLRIDGMVTQPLTLRYTDTRAMPAVTAYRTLECISNEVGGDLMSTGLWTGVRLADLLQRVGVSPEAGALFFTSVDNFTADMPLTQALDPATLLVYQLNGRPLPSKHGAPVRVLGTATYGMKNPKWLTRIEAIKSTRAGFWQEQGWDEQGIVQTMSRIVTPVDGRQVRMGTVTIAGVAFAGARGISWVDVSIDGGKNWLEAQLLPAIGTNTWTFWQYQWQPPRPGGYTTVVRATDGTGVLQPAREADPFPSGATGYHHIRLGVTG